ncbi:MAG: DUF881 domain-containing protein [Bacillota bacterium]
MMKRQSVLAIALVVAVTGTMLAYQFRIQRAAASSLPVQRSEVLVENLQAVEKERDALRDEVAELRGQIAKSGAVSDQLSAVESQLAQARMAAGLEDVEGPGVIVVLDDSKRPAEKGQDPNVFLLHDDDLLKVVNELRDAGAEAISINGQRLVATSEIRCAGSTVSINNTRTAPPVEIRAIGDPAVLEASLRLRGGIAETLLFWGIQVDIKPQKLVVVPAYKGSLQPQFAKPVTGGAQ